MNNMIYLITFDEKNVKTLFEILARQRFILVEKYSKKEFSKIFSNVKVYYDLDLEEIKVKHGEAIAIEVNDIVYVFNLGAYR